MSPLQSWLGCLRIEAPLHQVGRHRQAVPAVGGHHELALGLGLDAVLLHELAHPVFAHPDATGQQFLVHARPAVFALDLGVDGTDVGQQGFVAEALGRPPWRLSRRRSQLK
jgi:hypothetical protein